MLEKPLLAWEFLFILIKTMKVSCCHHVSYFHPGDFSPLPFKFLEVPRSFSCIFSLSYELYCSVLSGLKGLEKYFAVLILADEKVLK